MKRNYIYQYNYVLRIMKVCLGYIILYRIDFSSLIQNGREMREGLEHRDLAF